MVNDGDEQRSMVTSVTVVFDSEVDGRATTERLRIYSHSTGEQVTAQVAWDAASFSARITFPTLTGGSLPNGQYTLFVDAVDFEEFGLRPLDANGDGEVGGMFEFAFHRLFGDTTGNSFVDNLDILRFRQTMNRTDAEPEYDARFDVTGTGTVGDAARTALLGAVAEPVVMAQVVPVIVVMPPAVTVAQVGDTVVFRVHVLAPVPVTIVWFRGETEIARGAGLFQLMLADLSSADFGAYRIQALTDWLEEESTWFELQEDVG
jgi:hypothetical protein